MKSGSQSGHAKTHRLVIKTENRIEFKVAWGATFEFPFSLLFGILGLGFCIRLLMHAEGLKTAPLLFSCILCIGFGYYIFGGGLRFYKNTNPIIFDRSFGEFWKGRKPPWQALDRAQLQHYAKLGEIHALQILS